MKDSQIIDALLNDHHLGNQELERLDYIRFLIDIALDTRKKEGKND